MPQAGNLNPPMEAAPSLRHAATSPNLRLTFNRYANLDTDSPVISGSPPNHNALPVKFLPLPSKYGQLSAMSLSSINLSNASKKDGSTSPLSRDSPVPENKASFSVGGDPSEDFSSTYSRMHIPTTVVHPCDSPTMTPGVTPGFSSPSSPTPMRRAFSGSLSTETDSLTHAKSWSNSGFFGWLTRSPSQRIQEEPTFFHQKEDMSSLQGLTSKSRLFKPRPKMPVSMSDVNVFTPTEY